MPAYQKIGQSAYKADLANIENLCDYLMHPETKFKSIHVAGTNGKGSVSHMLASVLQEAGYRVGLYTSPHLIDFRERIRINGESISKQEVVEWVAQHKEYFEKHELSFFEMTVGMAFEYFAVKQVDIAVIEVGLGGRLDSTNVIIPEVSVITNIGLDHVQILGNTLPLIAKEKAGIIKKGIPVVIGQMHDATTAVFLEVAQTIRAPIHFAETMSFPVYDCPLKGEYQQKNMKTALAALRVLSAANWNISEKHIAYGLENVIKNTGLLGRWQVLGEAPLIVTDTAHNTMGLTIVLRQLMALPAAQIHIVLGMVNDKDLDGILPLFPKTARYYFCAPDVLRGLDALILQEHAANQGLIGGVYETVIKAYNAAKNSAKAADVIFVGGSTFVVAEIL